MAFSGFPLYTNEAIAGLLPLDPSDKQLLEYLYYVLPNIDYIPYAQRATKGHTLNSKTIMDVEVPFPDKKIRDM